MRYSLTRYLFASGTLVIFIFALSYSTFFPVRNATPPRRIVSVIGPVYRKLPGDCVLFLNASILTSAREMTELIANPKLQIVAVCDPNKKSTNYVDWSPNGIRDDIRKALGDTKIS